MHYLDISPLKFCLKSESYSLLVLIGAKQHFDLGAGPSSPPPGYALMVHHKGLCPPELLYSSVAFYKNNALLLSIFWFKYLL